MKLFSEDAGGIIKRKSSEFEQVFLEHLRLRHSNAQVNANNVYQQVIRDKAHVHMNATMWATLSDFIQYLGKTGKCQVEETERGWYVKYVPKHDAATLAQRQKQALRQEADRQAELDYVERMERLRKESSKLAPVTTEATKMEATGVDIKVALPTAVAKEPHKKKKVIPKSSVFGSDEEDEEMEPSVALVPPPPAVHLPSKSGAKRPRDDSSRTMEASSKPKQEKHLGDKDSKKQKEEPWLYRGIIVRIIHKKLDYFKEKAVVDRLVDDFTAEVCLLDNERVRLRLDQRHVETVVPKHPGEKVRIVKGTHRGKKATVKELHKKDYRAVLKLRDDSKQLIELDFDDFTRME